MIETWNYPILRGSRQAETQTSLSSLNGYDASMENLGTSCWMYVFGFFVIRCPTCGNDLVYSPIPSLYFCLELMVGENIVINLKCKPWIPEDAPVDDLLKLTNRIEKLAPNIIQRQSQTGLPSNSHPGRSPRTG